MKHAKESASPGELACPHLRDHPTRQAKQRNIPNHGRNVPTLFVQLDGSRLFLGWELGVPCSQSSSDLRGQETVGIPRLSRDFGDLSRFVPDNSSPARHLYVAASPPRLFPVRVLLLALFNPFYPLLNPFVAWSSFLLCDPDQTLDFLRDFEFFYFHFRSQNPKPKSDVDTIKHNNVNRLFKPNFLPANHLRSWTPIFVENKNTILQKSFECPTPPIKIVDFPPQVFDLTLFSFQFTGSRVRQFLNLRTFEPVKLRCSLD